MMITYVWWCGGSGCLVKAEETFLPEAFEIILHTRYYNLFRFSLWNSFIGNTCNQSVFRSKFVLIIKFSEMDLTLTTSMSYTVYEKLSRPWNGANSARTSVAEDYGVITCLWLLANGIFTFFHKVQSNTAIVIRHVTYLANGIFTFLHKVQSNAAIVIRHVTYLANGIFTFLHKEQSNAAIVIRHVTSCKWHIYLFS